ncbi:hypothetical protein ACFYM0_36170 [Streptomyces sp. NPDC006487]|uniref:hypothetical protein n=1 Tax=Streptomyces sp. NPDC006487 TaxID=3364748 RepID=UPI00367C2C8B
MVTAVRTTSAQAAAPRTGCPLHDTRPSWSQVVGDAYDYILETYGTRAATTADRSSAGPRM